MREPKILTVIVYLSVLFFYCDCEDPCDFLLSVDITNGSKLLNGTIDHNGLRYSPKQYFNFIDEEKRKQTRGCICLVKTCMRKCCPMGQGLKNNTCVQSEEGVVKKFNPQIFTGNETSKLTAENHFGIIHNRSCHKELTKFTLYPGPETPEDEFYLQENGSLYLPDLDYHLKQFGPTNYCLDAFIDQPNPPVQVGEPVPDLAANWTTRYLAYICIENSSPKPKKDVFPYLMAGLAISIPFLLATFLVYAFVPELRNLQGKTLMNYIAGLILAFISLIIIQSPTNNQNKPGCVFMAFSTFFFFMVSFFWLNIMCIDVWMTFRKSVGVPCRGRREAEGRRYILYCLYGWGAPLPLTALLAFMQFKKDLPEYYIKPEFGQKRCWFIDWESNFLYFYLPVLILLVFNLLMFSITSYKILTTKRETAVLSIAGNRRNDQSTNEKQWFFVYLKLFIFMGISWITEVISFLIGGSDIIWIATDLLNTILGVFIFFTFVWKKQVKNLIIKRYNTLRYGPPISDTQRSRCRSNTSSFGQSSEYSKNTPAGVETTSFTDQ